MADRQPYFLPNHWISLNLILNLIKSHYHRTHKSHQILPDLTYLIESHRISSESCQISLISPNFIECTKSHRILQNPTWSHRISHNLANSHWISNLPCVSSNLRIWQKAHHIWSYLTETRQLYQMSLNVTKSHHTCISLNLTKSHISLNVIKSHWILLISLNFTKSHHTSLMSRYGET